MSRACHFRLTILIVRRQSFYVAPWQALTTAVDAMNVTERVCSQNLTASTSQCLDIYEMWSTITITSMTSFTSVVDITTTIGSGASLMIVETITASLAESATVYSLSTTLVLTTSTESAATQTSTISVSTSTMQVYAATATSSQGSTSTSTSTLFTTSTITHTLTSTTTMTPAVAATSA